MRIILRRPQTYEFRERFRGAPIPGLVFMDGAGAVRHTVALGGNDLLNVVLQSMNRAAR